MKRDFALVVPKGDGVNEVPTVTRFPNPTEANMVAQAIYGADAYAVEATRYDVDCSQHPAIYRDGVFYNVIDKYVFDDDGEIIETYTVEKEADYIPTEAEKIAYLEKQIALNLQMLSAPMKAISFMAPMLTDEQAVQVKEIYPEWLQSVGKSLNKGARVRYEKDLYKVVQDIPIVLSNQPPSIRTAALYTKIDENHSGEMNDPIPYTGNMELFAGKYYSEINSKGLEQVYRCTRNTSQPVYDKLEHLIGLYVEKI